MLGQNFGGKFWKVKKFEEINAKIFVAEFYDIQLPLFTLFGETYLKIVKRNLLSYGEKIKKNLLNAFATIRLTDNGKSLMIVPAHLNVTTLMISLKSDNLICGL